MNQSVRLKSGALYIGFMLLLLTTTAGFCVETKLIRAINQHQDLVNNSVRDMLFDPDGTMWFATLNGFVHYDGYRFKNYHHDAGDAHSVPSSNIYSLAFDARQRIWLATGDKLSIFDRLTERFTSPQNNDCDSGIKDLVSDKEGNIWGSSNSRQLFNYQVDSAQVRCFTLSGHNDQIKDDMVVTALAYDQTRHGIWMATAKGLVLFDIATQSTRFLSETQGDLAFSLVGVDLDSKGNVWAGSIGNGIYRFDPDSNTLKHFSPDTYPKLQGLNFTGFTEDSDGTLWIGTISSG
ncbi:MAG: hypothetical protein HRT35_30915, partial [Algicola sp.]|nr:hypothetical protein [Algicola sp.]